MSKLKLPDVTLVMQETREHKLALLAVEECVKKVEFAEVLIFTDRPLEFSPLTHVCNPRIITVDDWPDKLGWCRFSWYGTPMHIRTSHAVYCQWDASVWDQTVWRDEFLNYDYIGAPWWHKINNVGNSGFSLKSMRLARYVYNHRDFYQCDLPVEDDLLCRKYRPHLEDKGFVWAPMSVAYDFAYEGCGLERKQPPTKHFGFHAAFNFHWVFNHDQLIERAKLMLESPYIRESYMMRNFVESSPDIMRELAGDELEKLRAAKVK